MKLNNKSKTLFIPLYGKALMSKEKLFIDDPKAEEIIKSIDYDFSRLKQSKWLSMFMAVRSKIMDEICLKYMSENHNLTIIHLGCGLDSRCLRVGKKCNKWYDIDFPNVIELRKKFYSENENYEMIGSSVTDLQWLDNIDKDDNTLVVAEGLTMYLSEEEIKKILNGINNKFQIASIVFDAYSKQAVKSSKLKKPVNQMNVSIKWGMNKPSEFEALNEHLTFAHEYLIKHKENNLKGITKFIFENLYCGKIAESLYKIYEFGFEKR